MDEPIRLRSRFEHLFNVWLSAKKLREMHAETAKLKQTLVHDLRGREITAVIVDEFYKRPRSGS